MSIVKILFATDLGARARAALTALFAVVTALVLFLQAVAGVLEVLPDWEFIGAAALWLQGVITLIGRFSRFGNAIETRVIDESTAG